MTPEPSEESGSRSSHCDNARGANADEVRFKIARRAGTRKEKEKRKRCPPLPHESTRNAGDVESLAAVGAELEHV